MKLSGSNKEILKYLEPYARSLAIFFTDHGILVNHKTQSALLPFYDTTQQLPLTLSYAQLDNSVLVITCQTFLNDEQLLKLGFLNMPVKMYLAQVTDQSQLSLLRAYHWLNWDKQSQFCGQCGKILSSLIESTEKKCATCGLSFFPRFSPAVMVAIYRNKEILLGRSKHFAPGIYSAIAGFLEIGETAELAAHREVSEELKIKIGELNYFATQTWPFPDSFMIAFTAKYVSGDIQIDTNELEDAKWFELTKLPHLPNHASIARKLIQHLITQLSDP